MTNDNGQTTGDALVHRLLWDPDDGAASDLLQAFFRGYPVERLVALLRSDADHAVRAGTWIASELGEQAAPLIGEIDRLLDHPARYVRFFALDAVLACASVEDGATVARAIKKIADSDEAVRWKTLHLLAKASTDQLGAALQCFGETELAMQLDWLLDSGTRSDGVVAKLGAQEDLSQLFAAVAAARLSRRDRTALERAAQSEHPEVSSFAAEELEGLL